MPRIEEARSLRTARKENGGLEKAVKGNINKWPEPQTGEWRSSMNCAIH
jgi:hypothetical protein